MNSLTREGKIVVFGGLAFLIAAAIGIYWWQRGDAILVQPSAERAVLYENCAKAEIPLIELDTTLDSEDKVAVIRWWDGQTQQNVELKLPYEQEIDFAGCSESAKRVLRHLQEIPRP